MHRMKKLLTSVLVFAFLVSVCSCAKTGGSGAGHKKNSDPSKPEYNGSDPTSLTDPGVTDMPNPNSPDGITEFTMYTNYVGNELNDSNEIQKLIAEKTGVSVRETWLPAMTQDEAIGVIIASGDYPDYIDGGDYNTTLYENGVLIAWDDYLEQYPNLKALYTDEEWEGFRQADGHIYWANVFERYKNKNTATTTNDQVFWIQVRVLEWADYPEIKTLDEYFTLLEAYSEANPTMPDGSSVIPYTCLCEDWRNFCIELPPLMLDGYANNHCVIVDTSEGPDKPKVVDYNTTDTAREYFRKLNEEYQKGIIDPDFSVQTYDEYVSKICTGRVLGMCDAYWDFGYMADDAFKTTQPGSYTLSSLGCNYVPLGLVMNGGDQRYHSYENTVNYTSGIGITTACYNPDLAFKFLNDLLSQEIQDLRFWGIEGVDYLVDENGLYYRTPEMTANWADYSYQASHCCKYSYMPQWKGLSDDGKNCMRPEEQPSIFKSTLPEPVVKCFDAYGVNNYVEFLGSKVEKPDPWFPLWTWSNYLSISTPGGEAYLKMGETKCMWIPRLVLSSDFDADWESYMSAYEACNPQAFLDEAQAEVNARMKGY